MRFLSLFLVFAFTGNMLHAQYVYTINADSVKITNHCDTAELIIENHTQNVPGFLFNKGRGRTEFRRVLQKLDSTTYLIGGDTLFMQSNAWVQGGNTFGATGILGTLDNNHLDIYTNNTRRGRWTNSGNLLIGSAIDNGQSLQVNGNMAIYGTSNGIQQLIKLPSTQSITTPVFQVRKSDGTTLFDMRVDEKNVSLGAQAGANNANSTLNNIAIGTQALYNNTTGHTNFAAGYQALYNNTTGFYNLAIGGDGPALFSNTTGSDNVALGSGALYHNTTGTGNVGINDNAGVFTTTGSNNVSIGFHTFYNNQAGSNNVAIGTQALASIAAGKHDYNNCVAVGVGAAQQYVNGDNSTFVGALANWGYSSGANAVVIGYNANSITGANNTLVGTNSLANGGANNVIVGYNSSINANGANTTVLAHDVLTSLSNVSILSRSDQNAIIGSIASAQTDNGSKLQVYGNSFLDGSVRITGLTNDTTQTRVVVSDANGNLFYRSLSSWAVNGVFNSSLAVRGVLSTQQLKLMPPGWADYVFDETYRLPSLTEVEAYIKQNNRLPGMPSAAEVQQKGIEVGESQAALLKKIEELTLYVIEQDKKAQKQNEEINLLKEQNKELGSLKQEMADLKKLIVK